MKKLITIVALFFSALTFAQTCELKLEHIFEIDSQENFERVLIENNFQNLSSKENVKKQIKEMSKKDTLFLAYGFEGWTEYASSRQTILALGSFPIKSKTESDGGFDLGFVISNPEDEYSVYSMIFSEVKQKCTFDKVDHTDDGGSAAFYTCPNASFKGKIGFSIQDDSGFIIIKPAEPLKELDFLIGDFKEDNSKATGDPNASGYYGSGGSGDGGNYRLGNRKALNKPKPTYDCNEEGKVYVSISVDNTGRVFAAQSGVNGTTNSANCLLTKAKEAALKTRFNSDSNAPSNQIGIIIYNFSLSD